MNSTENLKEKFIKLSMTLLTLYTWIAGCVVIYWLLLKITGHSPDPLEILTIFISVVITTLITGGYVLGIKLGKIDRLSFQLDSLSKEFKHHIHQYQDHVERYHK